MSTVDLGRPITVPENKKQQFKALTSAPDVAWKTVALAVVSMCIVAATDLAALAGELNIYLACFIVSVCYYWFFSVMHDSVHRSVSKNKKLNEFIGQLATSIYAPFATISILRWAHMEHHRFTNDEEGDPDYFCHGSLWTLPFRWMVIDFYYIIRMVKANKPQSRQAIRDSLKFIVPGLLLVAIICANGYWFEYLLLWFLPSRLAFIYIGFSFFWLPHAHWPNPDHELKQSKNYTIATTVRLGKEWIMNPLLQYQNYHLIHHLWPTTPFYNNQKVWNLLEDELQERDLAVQSDFNIYPELRYANANQQESTVNA